MLSAPGGRLVVILLSVILAGDLIACGESLFRVGKGLNYQEYTAPLPGNIIAVASTPDERAFLERLAAAGHHVDVVTSPDELPATLARGDYDIVLAWFSERESVERALASSSATYLPVVRQGTGEARAARDAYSFTVTDDDSVLRYLKTIHKTLKQRNV